MSPPSLKMIQRDKYRRIKGEIVRVALKAPAKAIEEKECGKYISTRTLGTHSITQLNKNCVYNETILPRSPANAAALLRRRK